MTPLVRSGMLLLVLLMLPGMLPGCLVDPVLLGPPVRKDAQGRLTLPLQVSTAFGPTGFFWNSHFTPDSTTLRVDSVKWRKYLSFQSIDMKLDRCPGRPPGLVDRDRHECLEFTYAPKEVEDLFAGVFWLARNNFGSAPGLPVASGAKRITFWARSLDTAQSVVFGAGLRNAPDLKPMPLYSRHPDLWGSSDTVWTPWRHYGADNQVVEDSLPAGRNVKSPKLVLEPAWNQYALDLTGLNGGKALGDFRLVGAFYFSIEAVDVRGSATFYIDGIQYE